MSRTRRRKHWGEPGIVRDGGVPVNGQPSAKVFAVDVQRPERRGRDSEAQRLRRDEIDPDDTPVRPMRWRLWHYWRSW